WTGPRGQGARWAGACRSADARRPEVHHVHLEGEARIPRRGHDSRPELPRVVVIGSWKQLVGSAEENNAPPGRVIGHGLAGAVDRRSRGPITGPVGAVPQPGVAG